MFSTLSKTNINSNIYFVVSKWFQFVIEQKFCHLVFSQLFPKQQILDSSKLKAFADDNFNFDEMAERSSNGQKTPCK